MEDTGSRPTELPSGTVTFLFTDIEGSTRLERELRERYGEVLAEHQRLLREAFERHRGREVDTQGDSFFAVFPRARDAVAAAVELQRSLAAADWPDGRPVRVRVGMHTGEAAVSGNRYTGLAVHRAARISGAGHGGQILLSGSTRDVVEDDLPPDQQLRDLGEHRLKDLPRPERVFQLLAPGLIEDFPPLKTIEEQGDLLPAARPWGLRPRLLVPLVAAAAVAAAGALLLARGEETGAAGVSANALGLVDAASGRIDGEVALDAAPSGVARGAGALWVTNANDGTVSRIDREERTVRQTIDVGANPSGLAFGAGAVWVANHGDATVSRISPETNEVVQTIDVGNGPLAVAFGAGSVWVTNSDDRTVYRLDPESGDVAGRFDTDANGRGLAVGAGSVWITDDASRRVMRLDPATGEVEEISVGNGPTGIAVGAGSVWVANTIDGTVSRIDPADSRVAATIMVPDGPGAIGAADGRVWVSAEFGEQLVRVDPGSNSVVERVRLGNRPKGVAVGEDGLWVAVQASGRGHRGGRLVIEAEPVESIDPAVSVFSATFEGSLVYDGLVGYRWAGGSDGTRLVPNLAVAIPRPRDGGRTYAFRLRPGVRYSTGEPVEAADFRRALERMFRLGGVLGQFAAITGAERCVQGKPCDLSRGVVARGRTVTFRLREPNPFLLLELTRLFPAPAGTPDEDVGTRAMAGTGPYKIDGYVPGRQIALVRNPAFRVWSEAARPDGYPDEIVFRLGTNAKRSLARTVEGKADVLLQGIPGEELAGLAARYPRRLHGGPQRATVFLFLDRTQPPFDDLRVRRAVNFAVDRRRVAELGGPGTAQPTCQVVPPTVPGHVRYCPYTLDPDPSGEWKAPDLARARQLVAASGTRGQQVTVWTFAGFGKEGRYAASLLRSLGYRVRLREIPGFVRYFSVIADPNTRAQSGMAGWFGSATGYDALAALRCGLADNWARFCDREVDRRLRRSLTVLPTDPSAAAKAWAELDRRVVDQAPWVPLFTPRTPFFVSKRVGNVQENPYLGVLLDQLWVR